MPRPPRTPSRSSRWAAVSKRGDTLCVIEAMKLMNEITAEQDGHDRRDLRAERQAVEYGTPLFRYEEG